MCVFFSGCAQAQFIALSQMGIHQAQRALPRLMGLGWKGPLLEQ